jgi:hypothetical protein
MVSVASAQTAWVPLGKMTCKIEGWATDTDPKGLNVRAKPSTKARILGTLPPYVSKENFGIEINIIGSQRGWLRITNATDNPDRSLLPLRKPYSGTGWVHGSRVGFTVQSGIGYQRPDRKSPQLVNIFDDWLTDMGKITKVIACQNDWVLVDYQITLRRTKTDGLEKLTPTEQKKSQGRAWFQGVCGSQETTCEGLTPDRKR